MKYFRRELAGLEKDPKADEEKFGDIANDKKRAKDKTGEKEEEDAAKMKWKGSLKIRRGKLKKLSLDGSPDERQQS